MNLKKDFDGETFLKDWHPMMKHNLNELEAECAALGNTADELIAGKVDKTQYASTDQAGVIKLYSSSGTNRSGLVVYEDGSAVVYTDSEKGTARTEDGKVVIDAATETEIEEMTQSYKPIVPATLKTAVEKITGKTADIAIKDKNGINTPLLSQGGLVQALNALASSTEKARNTDVISFINSEDLSWFGDRATMKPPMALPDGMYFWIPDRESRSICGLTYISESNEALFKAGYLYLIELGENKRVLYSQYDEEMRINTELKTATSDKVTKIYCNYDDNVSTISATDTGTILYRGDGALDSIYVYSGLISANLDTGANDYIWYKLVTEGLMKDYVNQKYSTLPVAKCSTSSDNPDKTASADGFVLLDGASVYVDFEHDVIVHESLENITLNINDTGAKSMTFNSVDTFGGYYHGDLPQTMIYNGVRCLVTYCESADMYIINSPESYLAQHACFEAESHKEALDSINAEITEIDNRIEKVTEGIKNELISLENDNYLTSPLTINSISPGWKLIDNGLCVQDDNYKIIKYKVTEGNLYSISNAVSFQFQNMINVPSTGTPNRVGETYFVDNILFAPTGSNFLIVTAESNANPDVLEYNRNCNYYPCWNNEVGGIYISDDKQKVCINKNGFLLKFDNVMYYIAPIDRISNYAFEGEIGNVFALCIDKTKLLNEFSRNEPSEVLAVVGMTGSDYTFNSKRYIPIALWYKTYWAFYGKFKYFEQAYSNSEIDAKINGIVDKRVFVNSNICMFNLCSHRGDSSKTNNTIEAFESAYQLGYRVVECDLRFTSDGHCVAFHDATIDGTAISSMDLATMRSNYSYIPTLTDVLLWAKKRQCAVELDCAARVSQRDILYVYDKCVKYNMHNSVIITAYENELMHLVDSNRCDTNVAVSLADGVPTNDKIDAISDDIKRFNSRFVSIDKMYLTDDIVSYAHALNFNVQTWTVANETEAQQLYLTGVDLILCDLSTVWEI